MVSARGSSVITGGAVCCAAGFSVISERGPGDGGIEKVGSTGRVDGESEDFFWQRFEGPELAR